MAIITRETESVVGVVTKADVKEYIPFWESVFLPGVYLRDAIRYSGRYLAEVGSGDERHEVKFKYSGLKSRWPGPFKERSLVLIASTKVKFLGLTVPFISRDRLAA